MGFYVVGSLSDECSCDQSKVPIITSETEPLHNFRLTPHPTAALEDFILEKQQSYRLPDDVKSTDSAARQLECLSIGDTVGCSTLQGQESIGPLHDFPPHGLAADRTLSSHSVSLRGLQPPSIVLTPREQQCSSPSPSVASMRSSASSAAGSSAVSKAHRARFLVFIKILFKCLDHANEHELRDRAKQLVGECTRRNRMGDPHFTPLVEAVERRLRRFVGEVHWRKASMLLRHFAAKQNRLVATAAIPQEISSGEA